MARPGLRNHPKFRTLVFTLGVSEAQAIGHLELLWLASYESGDPVIGGPVQVEATAGWHGDKDRLFEAMRDCGGNGRAGFIEEVPGAPGQYQVHDLYDHAPDYVKKRRQREDERKRKPRPRKTVAAADNGGQCPPRGGQRRTTADNVRPPTPAPAPSTHLGEESPKNPSCPEPAGPASGPPAPAEPDPPVLTYPAVGTPGEWPLTASKLAEYRETFPALDVLAECRKALQWCRDNPAKRKTARGMPKFLSGWLGRAQDRGGGGRARDSPTRLPFADTSERLRVFAEEQRCRNGTTPGPNGTPKSSAC